MILAAQRYATRWISVRSANLVKSAREIGIKGRSSMSKSQLVSALRKH